MSYQLKKKDLFFLLLKNTRVCPIVIEYIEGFLFIQTMHINTYYADSSLSKDTCLKSIAQEKVLNLLSEIINDPKEVAIMVTDTITTKILSCLFQVNDLHNKQFFLMERLNRPRQCYPETPVVYFITPSTASIQRVVDDFSQPKRPQYGNVHLLFSSTLQLEEMDLLRSNADLLSRIKTIKGVFLEYILLEASTFTLKMESAFNALYSPKYELECRQSYDEKNAIVSLESTLSCIANRLVTVCVTLCEYPYIRYPKDQRQAERLARLFHERMNLYIAQDHSFEYKPERGTLLLLDRAQDPLSPLVHDCTYQSVLYDSGILTEADEGRVKYQYETNRDERHEETVLLDDNDAIWREFRHKQFAYVSEELSKRVQSVSTHTNTMSNSMTVSLSEMSKSVRGLTRHKEMKRNVSKHVHFATRAMDVFTKGKLFEIAELERILVTGVDDAGKKRKSNAELLKQVESILKTTDISLQNKIRLLAIFMITQVSRMWIVSI